MVTICLPKAAAMGKDHQSKYLHMGLLRVFRFKVDCKDKPITIGVDHQSRDAIKLRNYFINHRFTDSYICL